MSEKPTRESPFGRLSSERLGAGPLPRATRSGKHERGRGATPTPTRVVVLVDPLPAVFDLVAGRWFQRHPERWALTQWHVPGGPAHTKLLFFLKEPEDALRFLVEAAREADGGREDEHHWNTSPRLCLRRNPP